jgi:hypothetical protein
LKGEIKLNIKQLLHYNDHQNKLYIHNEIFEELKVLHNKGSSHVAFTYTYYYLISWLYRFTKYGELNIDVKMIKEILGYNATNKKLDYLIKKGGLLDEIGLTETITNYPLLWTFEDGDLEFTMLNDFDEDIRKLYQKQKGKNYKIKVPVKGLTRNGENGTFYDIYYTHEMTFDLFAACMESDLGCSGFYLYGYLKYRCNKFGEYNSSIERLGEEIGMSKNTVDKYLGILCREGLISYKGNDCRLIDGEFNKKANTYTVN